MDKSNGYNRLFHVSSSPHVRSRLSTAGVMYDVILALMPATFMGVYRFGMHAALVIAVAILTAVLTEFIFDYIAKKPNTVKDGSAVVTGLLLALCLPAGVPLYVPYAGSLFAILVVKCFFGGLGHNFMNPALAGRCFLLISFSGVVADFSIDGMSAATPLEDLAAGKVINITEVLMGFGNGVIGGSVLALLFGGLYLWVIGAITFEIPVAVLVSFAAFIAIFGGQGFDPLFILAHLAGGGIMMAAFFMATDPVTSPVTSTGQLLYGVLVGILSGIFRVYGSAADSVSYAVIISNLAVPLIEEVTVPVPFGYRTQPQRQEEKGGIGIPRSALILCGITAVAGVCLSGIYEMTKEAISEQQMAANIASYQEVCPDASDFSYDDALTGAVDALGGEIYGTDYGKSYINEIVVGTDSSGTPVGYVMSVSSGDAYDGSLTFSLGISADGTVNGISFTELNETPGLGMLCGEDEFKSQFSGVNVEKFTLNKSGGSTADDEIDSVSGASTTSGAVVNAVNAALDFFAANVK